ncbi:MAG: hypothetical protein ACYTGW_17895 [Planctomycetota bacterium]
MEIGIDKVQSGPLARVQNKVIDLLKHGAPESLFDDKFSRFMSLQDEKCLPVRLQIFSSGTDNGMDERPVLIVVDSAAPLDLTSLAAEDDTEALADMDNAWGHGSSAIRQLSTGKGCSRIIAGNVFGDRPQSSPLFLGKDLPQPKRLKKSLVQRLRKAPYYIMLDVGVLASHQDPAELQQMTALVGQHGLLVGATLQEMRGRPALDLIWGARPGQGLLGMFLPRKPSDAKVLGSLPFDPSFMLLANVGREGRQGLITVVRAALAGGGKQPGLQPLLDLLDCWDGQVQFMSRLPDPAAMPLAAIRPVGPEKLQGPAFSIVLKVEEDAEAEAVRTLKQLIPAMAGVNPRLMVFRNKGGVHSTNFGRGRLSIHGADGLVVLAMGQSGAACTHVIQGVRDQFPVYTTPTRVAATRAPVKVFVNQDNIARITKQRPTVPPHVAARGEEHAEAYLFGYQLTTEIARQLFTDDVVYSLSWNKVCLRMRLQF